MLTAVGRGNVFPLESPTAETSDLESGLDAADVAKENCVAPPRLLVVVAELAETTDDGADVVLAGVEKLNAEAVEAEAVVDNPNPRAGFAAVLVAAVLAALAAGVRDTLGAPPPPDPKASPAPEVAPNPNPDEAVVVVTPGLEAAGANPKAGGGAENGVDLGAATEDDCDKEDMFPKGTGATFADTLSGFSGLAGDMGS